jgi:hypothetical protein
MPYSPQDVIGFPPPSTYRQIDFASLVAMADGTQEVPVVYAFGGNAPTMVSIGNGTPFAVSANSGYARMFVEFLPYAWNPLSPDWNGQ